MKTTIRYSILSAVMAATTLAYAHGDQKQSAAKRPQPNGAEETAFGRHGDPRKVSRTITVSMSDAMRFAPENIAVKRGETVRFVVRNQGKLLHEMVLGTKADLDKHAELMRKFPDMEHDEPNMAHVDPGKTGEIVWRFTKAGEFGFACLIPGHFEAGMVGKLTVK